MIETFHGGGANNWWDVFFSSASSTILEVATFVAIGLVIIEVLNYFARDKILYALQHSKNGQPLLGALLGLIPGCGGTLFLIPQYNKGKITFATLTASFISTMGEVAFIMIAIQPIVFLWVSLFSFITAIVVGYLIQWTPLKNKFTNDIKIKVKENKSKGKNKTPDWFQTIDNILTPIIVIGGLIVIFPFTIINLTPYHELIPEIMNIIEWISFSLTMTIIFYYLFRSIIVKHIFQWEDRIHTHSNDESLSHVMKDIFLNLLYIIFWVFVGRILIDSIIYYVGEDNIKWIFTHIGLWISLLFALIIGTIPGCGPAIIIYELFSSGALAGSALLANCIVQDGDAGLPLLAKKKKEFFWIKIFNIIPGFLMGSIFIIIELFGTPLF